MGQPVDGQWDGQWTASGTAGGRPVGRGSDTASPSLRSYISLDLHTYSRSSRANTAKIIAKVSNSVITLTNLPHLYKNSMHLG